MKQILIISANPHTLTACSRILSRGNYSDVKLISCNRLKSQEELLEIILAENPDVVVANGMRKNYIRDHLSSVTTINIRLSDYDILRALYKAKKINRSIGIILPQNTPHDFEIFENLLGIHIIAYNGNQFASPQDAVNKIINDGARVLIGGYSLLASVEVPKEIDTIILGLGEESILAAIEEARRISDAIAQIKKNQNLIYSFLQYTTNGIIAVDNNSIIQVFNPAAQRILQISETSAIGNILDDVCPPLSLEKVINTNTNEMDIVVSFRNINIICDKILINDDDIQIGALIIFQDLHHLQRSEASARRKIADSGLTAGKRFEDILGKSPEIRRAVEKAKAYAITESSILLLGESGTGKELFAQSIHNYSKRAAAPFVAINCAAMPPTLLESELFGYEPGAFTGARSKGKPGMFELANGGTLFLDEIGELDLQLQGKLLRALQERKIMRLGGDRIIPVDIRLITATNRNLYECVTRGSFRQDLYYRINVLKLVLPALRNCISDIPVLARSLLKKNAELIGSNLHFTADALKILQQHTWPGNVRELLNFIERLMALFSNRTTIDGKMIKDVFSEDREIMSFQMQSATSPTLSNSEDDVAEIKRVLEMTNGNYTQAAKILGLSRVTLWRKLKRNNAS